MRWHKYHIKVRLGNLVLAEDMFRYDRVYLEKKLVDGQVEADAYSKVRPTVGRWMSFQVEVTEIQRCIAPSGPMWTVIRKGKDISGELTWVREAEVNKKSGLSLEQHRVLGQRLKRVRAELLSVADEFATVYPQRGRLSGPMKASVKSLTAITHIQQAAVDAMILEHTDAAEETIYFGDF